MVRKDVRLGWVKQSHDSRDLHFRSVMAPQALPTSVDLTDAYFVPVVDQGQLGSCTGNGIASGLAYLQAKEEMAFNYPSRLFIYYNERAIEGTVSQDAGANIRDGIKTVVDLGFCPETDWPYDISKFTNKPSATAYSDALTDVVKTYQAVGTDNTSVMSALALGYAVIIGIDVYDSFMSSNTGDIPMPDLNNESLQGGHCIIVVGYDQATKRFKFENSWGTSWGQNGFGTLPFAYLPKYGSDFWIVTGDTPTPVPPTPGPTPGPTPTPAPPATNWKPWVILGVIVIVIAAFAVLIR